MRNKVIRAGLIGAGFAADFHIRALMKVYGVPVKISGVYARTQSGRNQFAANHGIQAYDDLSALIRASDVLHVCTPPATHEELAIIVLENDKHVIIEKPFTGYFGDDQEGFSGNSFSRREGFKRTCQRIDSMLEAEGRSRGRILYAENWIYAPAVQKEREVLENSKGQIYWMQAMQAHSGSHAKSYGTWRHSGGGSLMGKGAHPIAAVLYLKQVEGKCRSGKAIRPGSVHCITRRITDLSGFDFKGNIRTRYEDVEDYASLHIEFEDGSIADIVASELLQGGVKNYVEVHATNHRTVCHIAPNNAMQLFNPSDENLKDVYVVEKTSTKEGWSNISPDEAWFNGYQHEMQAFYEAIASDGPLESDSTLAGDVIRTIYAGYVSAAEQGRTVNIQELIQSVS